MDAGSCDANAFVRLRRIFIDEEPALEVEDLGNSEALLKERKHFKAKAQELLRQGVAPTEQGWGGWLGQYDCALTLVAKEIQHPAPQRDARHGYACAQAMRSSTRRQRK